MIVTDAYNKIWNKVGIRPSVWDELLPVDCQTGCS